MPAVPEVHLAGVSLLVALTAVVDIAHAQTTSNGSGQVFPSKPVRIQAGQAPGGATDIYARVIAQKLNEAWKQAVVVENRAGAAGAIAAEYTAKAPPDGHVLLFATAGQIVINQHLNKLSYDPVRDLAPLAFVMNTGLLLVTHPSVPAKSVKELVALAKARPNQLNHGSGGSGSPAHLACELFKSLAGIRMTHVPFKGVGPSVVALLGGEIDVTFASTSATLPYVKVQRLRALAVSTAKRSAATPDLPTVAEAGVPGYQMNTWYGFFGPFALPKDLATRLHADITRAVAHPDVRERMLKDGAEADEMPLHQFAAFISADSARWSKVIREAGIKAE